MLSFAKIMEICEVLPKISSCVIILPNLWSYAKFCQKYRVVS
jgi:hypothetical protein